MSFTTDLLHWRSLTEAVNNIVVPGRMLLDMIWNKVGRKFPTRNIDIDIIEGNKLLAPFVTPIEAGIAVTRLGRTMRSIQAPRIRIKTALNSSDFQERMPGAQVYIDAQAFEASKTLKIGMEQQQLKDRMLRTIHWMCAQALSGTITVSQDNVAFTVDYLFPAAYKPTLTGNAVWSNANSNPIKDIDTWIRLQSLRGFAPKLGIMSPEAVDAFLVNAAVKDFMNKWNMDLGIVRRDASNFVARIRGVDFYEMNEQYINSAGNSVPMLAPNTVTLVDTDARFDMCFGAIEDLKAGGNVQTEWFAKTSEEDDPSVLWLIQEVDPLPVVNQPGSVVAATVL